MAHPPSSVPDELKAAPVRGDAIARGPHGAAMPDPRHSLTAGPRGPLLAADVHYFNLIQSFDRERIPERVVHAKGVGAHGYFEVTHDITGLCKASVFGSVGKRTDAFVRFSPVATFRGSTDTERNFVGFAMKFYTDQGNWDLVGNSAPVFFIRDPILFPSLIHSQMPDPKTGLKLAHTAWDFLSATPESVHAVTMLYGDRGVPASYRHMNGYGNHTFVLVNAEGKRTFVKFHVKADGGVKSLTSDAAEKLRGTDPDFLRRDLTDYLTAGGEASYTMFIQAIPEERAATLPYDVLDVTKVVPHADFPLQPVGRLVLNRTVDNFFCETEQSAFCPSNLVPGIEASNDRLLAGRMISYTDTQRYRLGVNFHQLPINVPRGVCPFATLMRDGFGAYKSPGPETSYHTGIPSSGGPQAMTDPSAMESPFTVSGVVGRYDLGKADDPDADFKQPRALYTRVLTEDERIRLTSNIAAHLSQASAEVQARMLALFYKVDEDYGRRVEALLKSIAAGVTALAVSKEPSGKSPVLTEFDVKRGHGIVDMGAGDNLLPAKAVQDVAVAGGGAAAGTTASVLPAEKGGFATGSHAAPATLTGSLAHMAKAALGGIKGVVDSVAGRAHTAVAAAAAGGAGGKTTTPLLAGTAAGSPPSPREGM